MAWATTPPREARQRYPERDPAFLGSTKAVRAVVVAALVAGFGGGVDGHVDDHLGALDLVGIGNPANPVDVADLCVAFDALYGIDGRAAPLFPVLSSSLMVVVPSVMLGSVRRGARPALRVVGAGGQDRPGVAARPTPTAVASGWRVGRRGVRRR